MKTFKLGLMFSLNSLVLTCSINGTRLIYINHPGITQNLLNSNLKKINSLNDK